MDIKFLILGSFFFTLENFKIKKVYQQFMFNGKSKSLRIRTNNIVSMCIFFFFYFYDKTNPWPDLFLCELASFLFSIFNKSNL